MAVSEYVVCIHHDRYLYWMLGYSVMCSSERAVIGVKELRLAIAKLEDLHNCTTGVSVPTAMEHVAWFLRHDLSDLIENLQQVESEIAAAPTPQLSQSALKIN